MKKLLLATDFSELARNAYGAAASLARDYDATILVVHEAEPLPSMYECAPIEYDRYQAQLNAKLEQELRHPSLQDMRVLGRVLCRGTKQAHIVDFARAEPFDLIVLSTHGRTGLAHALLGSFAERVARRSPVPVLTYRSQGADDQTFQPRSILVPFDFSENSKMVFPIIRLIGERFNADIRFLHVFPEVSVRGDWGVIQEHLRVSAETVTRMEDELRCLCDKELKRLNVSVASRFGDAYREIITEASSLSPDVILLPTHGWTGLERLYFGSVAEKVLRTSPCSVITIRPEKVHEEPKA